MICLKPIRLFLFQDLRVLISNCCDILTGMNRHALAARIAGLAGLLAVSTAGLAHPHAWIDLDVTVQVDDNDRVTGLEQRWVFDPLYSQVLLEVFRRESAGASDGERLQALAERLRDNISEYGYLTYVEQADRRLGVALAGDVAASVDGHDQLEFRFALALEGPVDASETPLRYKVFDPNYFFEMLHHSTDAIHLGGSEDRCIAAMEEPEPDPVHLARAAAVDIGAASADGLGQHFAETITVRCRSAE